MTPAAAELHDAAAVNSPDLRFINLRSDGLCIVLQ